VDPNLLSCTDCNMTCDNEAESVACDGLGCGQAVCACDHDFCLMLMPFSFTLHAVACSRNQLEVGFVMRCAERVPAFGSENSANMIHRLHVLVCGSQGHPKEVQG